MKKKVCIIGLGFVGLPMCINLASKGYDVIGIEKKNYKGIKIVRILKKSILNIKSSDVNLKKKFLIHKDKINFTNNIEDLSKSKIIIVSIGFDLTNKNFFNNLESITRKIGENVSKKSLIIYECTLPPGTCEKIIFPILKSELRKRKIQLNDIFFGYSFERVMPGNNYLNSINNNFRAYSGINNKSKKNIKLFLKSFINTKKYPLYEFNKIEECETCKIIENSYRALNISYTDEWMKFCSNRKLNLNSILDAIRLRPSHNNIMKTGIGVGGYCLTKDGYFANLSNNLFDKKKIDFKLTNLSMQINKKMTINSYNFINDVMKQKIGKKKILLLGTTYKEDVGDFRHSPSRMLYSLIKKKGFRIVSYDPYEKNEKRLTQEYIKKFDIIVFCIKHKEILKLNFQRLFKSNKYIFDLNHVIPKNLLKNKVKQNIHILGDYT